MITLQTLPTPTSNIINRGTLINHGSITIALNTSHLIPQVLFVPSGVALATSFQNS